MDKASNINPDMLIWAREKAGLTLDEAASKLNFSTSKASSAVDKLNAIEQAQNFPTRKQPFRMATVYRKPLSVFYLNTAPIRSDLGEDFRSLDTNITQREKSLLDTLLTTVRARQGLVRSLLEDEEYNPELGFVNSLNINAGVKHAVKQIKNTLDFDTLTIAQIQNSPDKLFNHLRNKSENIGVFVLLEGDFGSWQTRIGEDVFHGFSIADTIAPFIVINSNSVRISKSFTLLLPELCHIFWGLSGISGFSSVSHKYSFHNKIENFCNDVACEILLPSAIVNSCDYCESFSEGCETIEKIAHTYSVSEPIVVYKFQKLKNIDNKLGNQLISFYEERWTKQKQTKEKRGVPNFHVTKRNRLGEALLGLVSQKLRENELTNTKAALVLGVKPASVDTLLQL